MIHDVVDSVVSEVVGGHQWTPESATQEGHANQPAAVPGRRKRTVSVAGTSKTEESPILKASRMDENSNWLSGEATNKAEGQYHLQTTQPCP